MRRSLTIATTVAASGALFLAVPALAANNGTCDGSGPKAGQQTGAGRQAGTGPRRGMGPGANAGQGLMNLPTGTLTEDQKADLVFMAEEEKLAHDVYTVLGKKYPKTVIFKNISNSEQRHWDAMSMLLDRYGLADPTEGMAAGKFTNPELQTMYNDLVASGTTRTAALKVGVAIEEADIADLVEAAQGVTAPDVSKVYQNLTRASEKHLAAFQSRL
jgi:hypothetical protein